MNKPQLVLDAAGVIVTNFSPLFWKEIIGDSAISFEELKALFKKEMRLRLWTGEASLDEFWSWLSERTPQMDKLHTKRLIDKHLVSLPAFDLIIQWSVQADIHILSNHRTEWLAPVLNPIANNLKSITISSEAGCCKPDPTIYRLVQSKIEDPNASVIYVDDQEKNMVEAEKLGWHTIIADPGGEWVSEIEKQLSL
ncbi:HAD-IA family hydrolase [Paenibacillus sp. UNC451MF]|uniref:HAD-IA family hydrolase n=1 Tax=Paenibacillus sp. UNC451MF TaxID=1449063 RepID=UPI0018CC3132|nr:HAD-IA family hydrolase [Paenibacillus sp. UNC451MF]